MYERYKKSSGLWNYFQSDTDNKSKLATCNVCKRSISYKTTISNLKIHLKRSHPIQYNTLVEDSVDREQNETARMMTVATVTSVEQQASGTSRTQDVTLVQHIPEEMNCAASTSKFATAACSTYSAANSASSASTFNAPESASSKSSLSSVPKIPKTYQRSMTSYIPRKMGNEEKRKIDDYLLQLFTKDYQPFSIVEDRGFVEFVHMLNPSYQLPSRKFISRTLIPNMYQKCMEKTKQLVQDTAKKVCITTDCWTSRATESYIAITAHFLTDDYTFKSVLLDCCSFGGHHTAQNLADEIKRILNDWGLADQVTMTVSDMGVEWELSHRVSMAISDNASNIVKALTTELNYDHFGSFAHSINLVVQEGLKLFEETSEKVKKIVSHFKKSTNASEKLLQNQIRANVDTPLRLIQSVPTRWNSTYYMLERFIKLEEAVRVTTVMLTANLPIITVEEWDACRQLCQVLKPFEEVTRAISAEKYLTGSLPIVMVKGLFMVCENLQKEPYFGVVKQIIRKLQDELTERFGSIEQNSILGICTFLDPRFKYHYFSEATAASVKAKVNELVLAEISKLGESECVPQAKNSELESSAKPNFSYWTAINSVVATKKARSMPENKAIKEIDLYLDFELLDLMRCPRTWWKEHALYFPNLASV